MSAKHYLEKELGELFQADAEMWEFLQKGSLDGVWYWDLENPDNEWISPEFWQLLGIDPASKKHSPEEWQDIIFPEDLQVSLENFQRHCADEAHPYDQIVRYRHADGSTVWVRCRGLAIRNVEGKPIRMLGAHNDLTQLKVHAENARVHEQQKAELAHEKQVVEQVNEELSAFAYAVSHDLKAPANTAHMLLSELVNHSDTVFDDEGRELAETAMKTMDRMRNLIEDLLRYTRVIGQDLTFEPVDLNEILQNVADDLTGDIYDAQAEIAIGDLPLVYGHPLQMRALLQNLITNAIKFRRVGEACKIRVESSAHHNASRVMISVTDNGIGISDADKNRIFGMFKRLHGQSDRPGLGLGLALCRRIAINHGSDITVDTPENHPGSVFSVSLAKHGEQHVS